MNEIAPEKQNNSTSQTLPSSNGMLSRFAMSAFFSLSLDILQL
jgi:hypothetical protein